MKSQIFKYDISDNILYDLLEKICVKNNKFYILNNISYKKAEYHNYICDFYENLRPYYYKSKYFYLNRKQNYAMFVTIIRQLCRFKSINYVSKILYNKSSYDIVYHIYF